jgi:hypothetical protein
MEVEPSQTSRVPKLMETDYPDSPHVTRPGRITLHGCRHPFAQLTIAAGMRDAGA